MRSLQSISFLALALLGLFAPSASSEEAKLGIPIPALPAVINSPGVYVLQRDFEVNLQSGAALTIAADNVVIDFNGHTISNSHASATAGAYGVYSLDRANVTVRNGRIKGFNVGVFLNGSDSLSYGNLVEEMLLDRGTSCGIYLFGAHCIVRRCEVSKIGGSSLPTNMFNAGIAVSGVGARILDNNVSEVGAPAAGSFPAVGLYLRDGDGFAVGNRASQVHTGLYIASRASKFRNNVIGAGVTVPVDGGVDAGSTAVPGDIRRPPPPPVTGDPAPPWAPLANYEAWILDHFTAGERANQNTSGREADPDNDGRNNVEEFVSGTNPKEWDAPPTTFTFNLDSSYATSAAVYTTDDRLVRTLWRNVTYGPGAITRSWDGKDDRGTPVGSATYKVKVLSHNVQYVWDGLIGNTSTSIIGPSHHAAQGFIRSLAIDGTNAFYALGTQEGFPQVRHFNTGSPQTTTVVATNDWRVGFDLVATDGTLVYYSNMGGADPATANTTFIAASTVSDNLPVVFPSDPNREALPHIPGNPEYSGIDIVRHTPTPGQTNPNIPTGLAVQKNGNILAVSHGGKNEVRLFNKTTGAHLRNIAVPNPQGLAMTRALPGEPEELWVLTGTTARRYKDLNTEQPALDATISSGLVAPVAISASAVPGDKSVIIADGSKLNPLSPSDAPQSLKSYNGAGGFRDKYPDLEGGYAFRGPGVTFDKFQFHIGTAGRVERAGLAQASDSSVWVSDGATRRILRLKGTGGTWPLDQGVTLFDEIMFLVSNDNAIADPMTPTRVIGEGWLEFKVDYKLPLRQPGAWKLVQNWAAGLPQKYFHDKGGIQDVTTLSNGRVYGTITDFSFNIKTKIVVELPENGNLRICQDGNGNPLALPDAYTAYDFHGPYAAQPASFEKDGSQRYLRVSNPANPTVTWYQKDLDTFDGNGNPRWKPERVLASAPYKNTDPVAFQQLSHRQDRHPITSSNRLITFDSTHGKNPVPAGVPFSEAEKMHWMHLGGVEIRPSGSPPATQWSWKSAPTIFSLGPPPDGLGSYDLGNVAYPGSLAMVVGKNIVYGYPGEYWHQTQASQWMHFYDDGLFVGQFGTPGTFRNRFGEALPGFTGHSFLTTMVGVDGNNNAAADGEVYLWANDDGLHSGVARWHVVGTNTIREQTGSVPLGEGPVILSFIPPSVSAPPSALRAVPGDGQVVLSWNAVSGAGNYHIKFSTTNGGPYGPPQMTSGTSAVVNNLENGKAYYFVVSAAGSAVNSNQVVAFPFATVGKAGQFEGGQREPLEVSSQAPASGGPALVGLPGVLGDMTRTSVGTNGYVIYNWGGGGTSYGSLPVPYTSKVNVLSPFTVTLGTGWYNEIEGISNTFRVDSLAGAQAAIAANPHSTGTINITVSDNELHYVTVFCPARRADQQKYEITMRRTGQTSPVASYAVNEAVNASKNHAFQFAFRGNVTLSVINSSGNGAFLQALFFD